MEADANGNSHDDGYDIEEQAADGGGVEEERKLAGGGCEYVKQLLLAVSGPWERISHGRG